MEDNRETTLREQIANSFLGEEQETPVEETETAVVQEETPVQPTEQPVAEPVTEPTAQPSPTQDAYVQQLMQIVQQQQAMIQNLTQQSQQATQALQQQSHLAEAAIEKQTEPEPYPQFDFESIRYMDAEAQNQAVMNWQKGVMDKVAKDTVAQVLAQMAPIRDQYEANKRIAENDAARAAVFGDARFKDFAERRDNIESIIEHTDALRNMDATQRYVIAGLMDRGLRHANAPSAADIIAMAKANPEVMKALAVQQASEIAQSNAQVPTLAPSSGMAQVNATPDKRPSNIRELRNMIKKGLG